MHSKMRRGLLYRHSSSIVLAARAADLVAVSVSAWLAYFAVGGTLPMGSLYHSAVLVTVLVALLVFPGFGLYDTWRGARLSAEVKLVLTAWSAVLLAMALLGVATQAAVTVSRIWMFSWFGIGAVVLVSFRLLLRLAVRGMRAKGHNLRRVVIVGTGDLAQAVANQLMLSPWTGLKLVGFFDDRPETIDTLVEQQPVLGALDDMADFVERKRVDQVWIALPWRRETEVNHALHVLRHSTVAIRMVPDIYSYRLLNHSMSDVAGISVLDLTSSPLVGINGFIKGFEDKVLAILILALISPVMLFCAIGVKLSSPGPIFYRQERVGLNNRNFMMLKFRSMPVNVEDASGPVWAKPGESRATKFGAFLRKTSLDELPQFLNVLLGDMSIVGPRPERPHFVHQFKEEIPGYMQKHLVKAGITGWAQVNGWRGDTGLKQRIEHDLYYIENWSLWFDIKIIFMTVFKGFRHQNAY